MASTSSRSRDSLEPTQRRLPVGAEVVRQGGVHFRVWAPRHQRVSVILDPGSDAATVHRLTAEEGGYFSGQVDHAGAGTLYGYRLGEQEEVYPDPASRFQPQGVHGPSRVVDPGRFQWSDAKWPGIELRGQILYELHVGTFTPEGTLQAAARELAELKAAGITAVELMPVAEFAGDFGWGYDGVDLFAPTRLYGEPDDLRQFVDAAHALELGVILDVVYNHFGPTGNYLGAFSADYVSKRHHTDWGEALNFDGQNCRAVREFFLANASYWIDEFHFDGLRLDAVHAIVDDSPDHLLKQVGQSVRRAARGRKTLVIAESESQDNRITRSIAAGGFGLDAVWSDDFHHAARVAMTGRNEAYYIDYSGTPQEIISALKHGYLYQGQWNIRQKAKRGGPVWDMPGERFVTFLQNHDQVANAAAGTRTDQLTSPGRYRAMTAVTLLSPNTPMLFQGQEFGATTPFMYFADHEVDLAKLVRQGRFESLRQFSSMRGPDSANCFVDPCSRETFERSKLDFNERQTRAHVYRMHKDLIRLRTEDPVFRAQAADRLYTAVIGSAAFLLRFRGEGDDDRLIAVNLGRDLVLASHAEPLLAPPEARQWQLLWSSEDPKYGGFGTPPVDTERWHFPGHTAVVLTSQ
jgi:maltooligosyltrehalose trehalohydrolase